MMEKTASAAADISSKMTRTTLRRAPELHDERGA
jgi:hypothetical protein